MRRRKKAYRAVIINLRTAEKKIKSVLIFLLSLTALIFAICFSTPLKKNLPFSPESGLLRLLNRAVTVFAGFDPTQPFSIIKSEFPEISIYENAPLWKLAENGGDPASPVYNPEGVDVKETSPSPDKTDGAKRPIKAIDSSQSKSLSSGGESTRKILIKNETSYTVDVSKMLSEPLPFTFEKSKPEVLILHTHATESYTPDGDTYYDNTKSDRTQDTTKNVVFVGECMAEIFRENGIEVLHDTTLHDYPNYNGSYANSLKTGESYLKSYPSLKMIIDVHRDAIVYGDGTKAKVVTEIDGKKAAQLMFVIGTDAGGLTHPDWRKNLQLSVKLQSAIEEKYPGLMRGINLRKERFNEHLTAGSMILEVGTSGNTLYEAVYGARCAARVIAQTLSENND